MITIDPSKVCYIFDVDGTLTEPRKLIETQHEKALIKWAKNKQCFLATGSDFVKTTEQLTGDLLRCFKLIYCCMGNEVRNNNGECIKKNELLTPEGLLDDLSYFLDKTDFKYKTGNHFEYRTGMLNFSVVGRNASHKQRSEYYKWDKQFLERELIAKFINEKYHTIQCSIGGSISIDIIEKEKDKGQIIRQLNSLGAKKVVFVGDRCFPGGNDHGIVNQLENSDLLYKWYNVDGPKETFALIKEKGIFNLF